MTDYPDDRRDLSIFPQTLRRLMLKVLAERERFADHSATPFGCRHPRPADKMARETFAITIGPLNQDERGYLWMARWPCLPQVKAGLRRLRAPGSLAGRYGLRTWRHAAAWTTSWPPVTRFFTAAKSRPRAIRFLTTAAANLIRVFGSESQKSLFLAT